MADNKNKSPTPLSLFPCKLDGLMLAFVCWISLQNIKWNEEEINAEDVVTFVEFILDGADPRKDEKERTFPLKVKSNPKIESPQNIVEINGHPLCTVYDIVIKVNCSFFHLLAMLWFFDHLELLFFLFFWLLQICKKLT